MTPPAKPKDRHLVTGFAVVTTASLLVCLFSNFSSISQALNIFFCSDTLYLPSVYKDLFIDKNSLKGWHLNPAPNYFPDMTFYFFLMFITGNFIVSSFLFSLLQYLALGLVFVKLFRLIYPLHSVYYRAFIYTIMAFFLLEPLFFSKDFLNVYYLITNASHTGAFLMSMVCFFLTLKYVSEARPVFMICLFFAGSAAIVSDPLFIVLYTLPAVITCGFLSKRTGRKRAVTVILIAFLLTVVGLIFYKYLETNEYRILNKTKDALNFDIISGQFGIFFAQVHYYLSKFGVWALAICLFLVSMGLMILLLLKPEKEAVQPPLKTFYALYSIVFSICTICAPMLTGKYIGYDCLRYNIYPVYLSALSIAIFAASRAGTGNFPEKARWVILSANGLLLVVALWQLKVYGLRDYFNYYPDIAKEMDALAEKENLVYGVANYWDAHKISMFSKRGVKVCAVFDNISAYGHVANDQWFYKNIFNFVVLNNFKDTTLYRQKLKNIRVISDSPQLHAIKTAPFRYFKWMGYEVQNIND
jgi:hypothetical protein